MKQTFFDPVNSKCVSFDNIPKIADFGDENDLIRRGDALKAIRKACISAHLPFDSATPEGQRVMEALYVVWKVKKQNNHLDVKKMMNEWISVKDRLPKSRFVVLAYEKPLNSINMSFYEKNSESWIDCDSGYYLNSVTHWMPLPNPPEETANDSI